MAHGGDASAGPRGDIRGRTDRGARVVRRRLHEQLAHPGHGNDALVQLHVQGDATREHDAAGLPQHVADVMLNEFERGVLEQLLHRGGIVHVRIIDLVADAARTKPLDQLRAEVEVAAVFLVAAHADDIDQARVDAETARTVSEQARQVVTGRVAIRRHAHDLELAVEHLEAEVFSHRGIETAERVRIVKRLALGDAAVLADTEERRRVFTLAIDADDRGLFLEAAQVIGARCMREMVLDHLDAHAVRADAQVVAELAQSREIAPVTAVAVEERRQRAIRRIPVAPREMPARE